MCNNIPIQPTASLSASNAQTSEKSLLPHPANYAVVLEFANGKGCGWEIGRRDQPASGPGVTDVATKKEEFTGLMVTWSLGTPFPRSALFLE